MLNRLETKHWLLIASFLTATATVVGGLDTWADVLKPSVVSGLLIQFATLMGAVFAGPPPNPNHNALENPGRRARDPLPPTDLGEVTDTTRRSL